MKVQTVDSFIESHGIKMLITGESGVGKTRSAISLKESGFKPLIVSAESGVLSLQGSGIPMIDIARNDDGKEIPMEKRFDRLGEVFKWLKLGQKDYDTVMLDSLTEVNQTLMASLNAKYPDRKDSLPKYGENSETMLKLVRAFRDLPYHVVIVSLSEVEKDDIGRRFTTASVIGKVANFLPSLMDEVLNLQIFQDDHGKVTRRFQCSPSGQIVCKDRSGKLDAYEPADLGKIFLKIQGKQIAETTKEQK